jgi:transposase InsO family protein
VMRSEVAVSERRACGLIQIHRGTYRYRRRPEDGQLRVWLRELAEERRRFGYRRLQVLLVQRRVGSKQKRLLWHPLLEICTRCIGHEVSRLRFHFETP